MRGKYPTLQSSHSFARALICAVLSILAACSGGGGSGSTSAPTVKSIEITPVNPQVAAGMKMQLTATAVMSDNTHKDITTKAVWASSNPSSATVSNTGGSNGVVTALSAGAATISASTAGVASQAKLAVTAALLMSIEVTPPAPSIAKGTSVQLTATGVFSDHTTQNLTSQVTWTSSDTSVAMFSSTTGSRGLVAGTGVGSVHISAHLNGVASPSLNMTVTAATLVSIQVTPPSPSLPRGLTQQFIAVGIYSDNSVQDLTSTVTWASSDSSIASVSNAPGANGMASATGLGSASISATLGSVTSPDATLTVTAATLSAIQVTPPSPSVANGLTQQFTAIGVYSDNSKQDLTSIVTWSSANSAVGTVSNATGSSGLATAVMVGWSSITASWGLVVSPAATLTVTPASLVSIQVTPPSASIANGLTQQFTATGTYTDNSTQDLTQAVTWSSSVSAVATISNAAGTNGLASSAGTGPTNVTASFSGVTSSPVVLSVTPATLVSIQVTPPSPSIANGLIQQFTATGTYTDNSTQDLTQAVTWSSSVPAVATISNAGGTNGLASSAGTGSTNVTASFSGVISSPVVLSVTPATLVSIQVTPPSPSIANGLTQQFSATGSYTDNTVQDLTAVATWSSSNTTAATISSAPGSYGLATAAGIGSSSISASYGGITSANATLTVTSAALGSIQVTPANPTIPNGLTQQFTATGTYTDNSTQDLTSIVTWGSSDTSVATVSSAPGSSGLATAAGPGASSISASYNGVTSSNATLTVTTAALVSIQVTPPNPAIANGLTQQFTATGTYTDNSTQDLTSLVTWNSSNINVASVSSAPGSNGLATAMGVGTTNISASYNGITSANAGLTVTAASLVSIEVTPPTAVVASGTVQPFNATGTYSDGSVQDLTASVNWGSSNTSVASISNVPGSNGLASAGGTGSTNITASLNGVTSAPATLTVTAATLVSIQLTPSSAIIANGTNQAFTATGTYSDNSTQDLTAVVTWASSNTGVATISNVAGSNGVASTAGVGSSGISASYGGVTSPAASLTVTAATLVSIAVSPLSPIIANGTAQPFTATGAYSDNSTQDLTSVVTWASSNTGVASISNAAGSNGLATAASIGSTNISATLNAITSPAVTLTVIAPTGAAGIWTATPAIGETALMVSDNAGNFYFSTSTATCVGVYNGTLTVAGSAVSGNGDFAPDPLGPAGCPAAAHEHYSGTIVPGVSMTLTAAGGGSSSTINWTLDPIYNQGSALSLVAGMWAMPDGSMATITGTGAISGHDANTGCVISGQVSVNSPAVDLYNVTARYSGCTGASATLNGLALSGLGMLDTSVTPTQLDVYLRSPNKKSMVFFNWVQQ